MRIYFRLDRVDEQHIHQTLFIDGKNCGQICTDHGGYQMFGVLLLCGKKFIPDHHVKLEMDDIGWDESGNFKIPDEHLKQT